MSQHYDICIQGSGIVGSTLALLLARERLRVALVRSPQRTTQESQGDIRADVRAYALNAASKKLLQDLRVWPDADYAAETAVTAFATPVLAMQVHGDAAGAAQGVVNFSAATQGVDALAWVVDVPALEAQLAQAVKFQPLIEVVENSNIRADLTVICEGKNSTTRAQLGVDFEVTPYHQHAIAARLTTTLPHDGVARQWFKGAAALGEILAFLPLNTAHLTTNSATNSTNLEPNGNSVALVWSVPNGRAKELMALPDDEFASAVAQASGMALGEMQMSSPRATWPLQLARAKRWVGVDAALGGAALGAWALAGDAAHTVHPLSGQGLNLGLADVAELAKVLGRRDTNDYWRKAGDMKLLRRYERARKLDVLALGAVTDGLQQLFASNNVANNAANTSATGLLQLLRNVGMQGFERSGALKHWVTQRAMGL